MSNYKNLPFTQVEPAGHGIGRSRGGWTTKIHHAVDGSGKPWAVVVTGGQRNDGAMLKQVLADKAYSNGVIRRSLRARGISAVIPEKSDQIAARKRRGCRDDRPPLQDTDAYKNRNAVERSFALNKQ